MIWNADVAGDLPAGVVKKPLTSVLAALNDHTKAVLVAAKTGPACQLLKKFLPVNIVSAIQQNVLAGRAVKKR